MRTAAQNVLDYALRYVGKGIPIFPVHYAEDGRCSCGNDGCKSVGKHPAVPGEPKGGHEHATLDEAQVKRWFGDKGARRGYNLGASCTDSGLICLDVDPKNGGLESLEQLIRDNQPLPDTWVEETGEDSEGNRGQHFWFLIPPGKQYKKRKALGGYPGVDLLANGYAIVAPSLHASGVRYEALTSVDEIVQAPQWVLDLTQEAEPEDIMLGAKSLAEPTGIRPGPDVRKFLRYGGIPPGAQRAMACKAARALWGIWVDIEDAADLVFDALSKCEWAEDDWTENQVRRLIADEYAKQPKALDNPTGVALPTDLGRAFRLRSFARGNLLHDRTSDSWYTWDSTVWKQGGETEPTRLVQAMALQELQEAQLSENGSERRKEAIAIQSASRVNAVLRMTRVLEGVDCESADFDSDPLLLNCSNCVVDLRNGSRREQRRSDMMTKSCSFAYREGARSKLWDKVVKDATSGDEDLIDFLQIAFGYAATGQTSEDAFFYLHGPGGTGKTTVLEAVSFALGSYATAADPETFMQSQVSLGVSHRADLAALKDARLVVSTEIAEGSKFSTSTLNRLTGNDTISARVPYARAPIVFKPQWTLFFAANHFPQVPGASRRDGFWRRVKIVPFENRLDRASMINTLRHILTVPEHGEAVLAWVIEGAIRWWDEYASKSRNIIEPRIVTHEVEEQQVAEDELFDFAQTLVFKKGAYTTRSNLHQYYLGWCEKNGIKMPKKPRAFAPQFRSTVEDLDVVESSKTVQGKQERVWLGVAVPISKRDIHNEQP